MDIFAAGGANFRHLNPFIPGEFGRHNFVGVINVALRGQRDGFRHGYDLIGLRNIPAGGPGARRGRIMRVAFGSIGVGPGDEGGNFLGGERRIIRKVAELGIGEPGRHDARGDFVRNDWCVEPGLVKGDERHGRDFAGTMAGLAMLLQDGQNIAIKSRRRRGGGFLLGASDRKTAQGEPGHNRGNEKLGRHA